MTRRQSIVLLSVVILVAVFLSLRLLLPNTVTPSETSSVDVGPTGSADRPQLAERSAPGFDWAGAASKKKLDSEQFVSLSRMGTDTNYIKRLIRRHMSIKSYLASPLKGDPEFEQVIDWLIGNGYGVEDVAQAWHALVIPASGMTSIDQVREHLRQKGKSRDQIEKSAEKILSVHEQQKRRIVSHWLCLGSDEGEILDSFLRMAPEQPTQRGPIDRFMPSTSPVEGERILRDEDWMSPDRKALAERYRGVRRSTDSRDEWRPSPSPLNEALKQDEVAAEVGAEQVRSTPVKNGQPVLAHPNW